MGNDITKILKNTTQSNIDIYGVRINPNGEYSIPVTEIDGFLNDVNLLDLIMSGDIIVNDGTDDLPALEGWEWLNTFYIDTDTYSNNEGKGMLSFQAGRNGTINGGSYMRISNGLAMDENIGWVAPWDGKIVAISIGRNNTDSSVIEVRINGNSTSAQLSTNDNTSYVNNLNVSFSAGDSLSIYLKSGKIKRGVVTVFCLWS